MSHLHAHRQGPRQVRIDSHHHLWDPAAGDYAWLRGLPAIDRPFGPDDFAPLLERHGLDGSIVVQTLANLDETRLLLALAADTPWLLGVIGWVDLTAHDVGAAIHDLRAAPGGEHLVGIRHQVHDEDDPDWLLRPDVQQGLHAVAEANLTYDLLIRPRELPAAVSVTRDFPHLRFVVDHIAKPPIASGEMEPWASQMHELSLVDNVTVKLSGMVTEASADWTADDLQPWVRAVLEMFGPTRIMFGSDWPVCLLAGTYDAVVEAAQITLAALDAFTHDEEVAIFGGTAAAIYRLHLPDLEG